MNDLGNVHEWTENPIGIEVHGFAYAARSTIEAISNSTIYEFRIFYRGNEAMENTYIGVGLDADLGDAGDDYVGSDSLLGLGFVYNSDNLDDGYGGYGTPPPALGLQLLDGPTAENDGLDNDHDGSVDEPGEILGATHIMYYFSGGGPWHDPHTGDRFYKYLQSIWGTGEPLTVGGAGRFWSDEPITYAFPGDPASGEFWSEVNNDSIGGVNPSADKRVIVSSGPFTLEPGDELSFAFSIVWARGEDHLDSVTELKKAVEIVHDAYKAGYSDFPKGNPPQEHVHPLSPGNSSSGQPLDPYLFWRETADAQGYQIELTTPDEIEHHSTRSTSIRVSNLLAGQSYDWRVRGENIHGFGPWSTISNFETGGDAYAFFRPFFSVFYTAANAQGPLPFPDFNPRLDPIGPCWPTQTSCAFPSGAYQQATNNSVWRIRSSNATSWYGPISDSTTFLGAFTNRGQNLPAIGGEDYEMRFTERGGLALQRNDSQSVMNVPFELWNIGTGTPDDRSDDFRLIPEICELACGAGTVDGIFDATGRYGQITDWIGWLAPLNRKPGEAGYERFFADRSGLGEVVFSDMKLIGDTEERILPETGTVFRILGSPGLAPALSTPTNGLYIDPGEITLYWTEATFDVSRLQISDRGDFGSPIVDSSLVVSPFSVTLTDPGWYVWRIQNYSKGWSATWAFEITGAENERPDARGLELFPNYPNPFHVETTIGYVVAAAGELRLDVFDLLGRRVRSYPIVPDRPGYHEVTLDLGSLASGVYLYSLRGDTRSSSRTMTVLR